MRKLKLTELTGFAPSDLNSEQAEEGGFERGHTPATHVARGRAEAAPLLSLSLRLAGDSHAYSCRRPFSPLLSAGPPCCILRWVCSQVGKGH